MEGNYITKAQRGKQVTYMKKTHFKLGDYVPEPNSSKPSNICTSQKSSEYLSLMRGSHFNLGNDKPVIKSEHKSRYNPNVPNTNPYVQPDVSIDLRKHHFTLGNYSEKATTTANDINAVNGMKGETAEKIMSSEFSKSHHFVYGTDKPTSSSTNQAHFIKKAIGITEKEEMFELKKQLQKTHFELGNSQGCFATTSREQFNTKKIEVEKGTADLLTEHFQMGTDKPSYSSVSQRAFTSRPCAKQGLDEASQKELRASHFLLGTKPPQYTLTSQEYKGDALDVNTRTLQDGALRKTNFTMGTHLAPYKTSYALSHSSTSANIAISTRNRFSDKKSSILMGSDRDKVVSVNHTDFTGHLAELLESNEHKNYLKKHHFQLGNENATMGRVQSMNALYGKVTGKPVERDVKMMNDLRTTHFCFGNSERDMGTTSQKEFKKGNGGELRVAGEKMHGAHSYVDRNGKMRWNTEQKDRFEWIKPIVDTNFKFSSE